MTLAGPARQPDRRETMSSSETQFQVQGMKCNGCIAKAREAVSKLPGFEDASFDLASGTAVVKGAVDPQAVIHALTKAGYPAQVRAG
jgi:copper chaperone